MVNFNEKVTSPFGWISVLVVLVYSSKDFANYFSIYVGEKVSQQMKTCSSLPMPSNS